MNFKESRPARRMAFALDIKSMSESGVFSGYASVFGNVDRANEIVAPGAFAESLAAIKSAGRALPLCWQHDFHEPIGDIPEFREDETGLYVQGELWLDESPRAKTALRGLRSKAVNGLSIGYRVLADERDAKSGARILKKLDLIEVSVVTSPCNPAAQVEMVKARLAEGHMPTLPEFEKFLREAGFSKSQATVIAGRGLKGLIASESDHDVAKRHAATALNASLDRFLHSL